ncbi:MAG: pyridoxamine 5'-phosphate oxidase [Bacteroidia bacterium]|jgi:pyridoxamine-phosphate oxidase|nr:pyridoxamine 5'-phosphate oxidase [Bacteroidia bacterium]
MNELVSQLRHEYSRESLDESSTAAHPAEQFERWFQEALKAELPEPHAMTLATVDANGKPSARIVLLRGGLPDGLMFFSNYLSRKGVELASNPYASLSFFWPELERQIRVEGKVSPVSAGISDEYFAQRPRGSQIGAWASPQSKPIGSRDELTEHEQRFELEFEGRAVARPPHWGGYLLHAEYFEFWQGRMSRLHDRVCYKLEDGRWKKFRIAP